MGCWKTRYTRLIALVAGASLSLPQCIYFIPHKHVVYQIPTILAR